MFCTTRRCSFENQLPPCSDVHLSSESTRHRWKGLVYIHDGGSGSRV